MMFKNIIKQSRITTTLEDTEQKCVNIAFEARSHFIFRQMILLATKPKSFKPHLTKSLTSKKGV